MKKLITMLLTTTLAFSSFPISTLNAQETSIKRPSFPVAVDPRTMPDEAVRQVAWYADKNSDNMLTQEEADAVSYMYIEQTHVTNFNELLSYFPNTTDIAMMGAVVDSLNGIYDFPNLKTVELDKPVFKKLDIDKFKKLEVIYMWRSESFFFPEGGKLPLSIMNNYWDVKMITGLGSEYGYMDVENGVVTSFTPDKSDSLYYMSKRGTTLTTVEVIITTSAMKKPTNLTAKQKTYNKINLSWEGGENALYYEVYRKAENSNTFKKIATTKEKNFTASVTPGRNYQFKVRGYRYVNGAKILTGFSSSIKGKATVAQVKSLKSSKKSSTEYKLSWEATDGAKKYQIYTANKKDGTYKRILTTRDTNITVKYNKDNRFYKVRAYRTTGGENLYGKFSAVVELPKK